MNVLHYVDGKTEGGTPIAMIQASDGNFYGVTYDSGTARTRHSSSDTAGRVLRRALVYWWSRR